MEISDSEFEEKVINKSKESPVIVDFYAEWCAPCNMLAPAIKKVVDSFDGKVILTKINIDHNSEAANKYMVNAIPAVKFFKDGKVVDEFVGLQPETKIKEMINKLI